MEGRSEKDSIWLASDSGGHIIITPQVIGSVQHPHPASTSPRMAVHHSTQ